MIKRKDYSRGKSVNLLDLKPLRNIEWETKEDGAVVLLVPKFRNGLLVRWLLPRLSRAYIRVSLDPLGSFVWNGLDGSATVGEIAEKMSKSFGESLDSTYDRTGRFVATLLREKFLVAGEESRPALS